MESPKSTETMITGRNGSIGARAAEPQQLAPPAPLEDRDDDAEGRGDRGDVHHGGLERDAEGAEGEQQQERSRAR